MKNKSIVMKILVVASIILILLLFVVVFSLIKIIIPEKTKKEEGRIITKSFSIDEIEDISFNFKKANSNFEISDEEKLVIVQKNKETKFFLNYKKNSKKIYFEEDSYIINPHKEKYTIYIPKNYVNKINIVNGFGKLTVTGIINNLYINNNSGDLKLKNIRNVKIKDVSGNVFFENAEGTIEVESSTGNIEMKNVIGIMNIESIAGDVELIDLDITGDSRFENVSGDITIKMKEQAICTINYSNESGKNYIDEKVCIDGLNLNLLKINNITGKIKVY